MPRNGSGTYQLPPSNPVFPGTEIDSTWANETMTDIGQALSQSLSTDGQTLPTGNLPMGGFHHTNVSDPTARNQYPSLAMVQDGRHQRVEITSGSDNLVGSLVGGATSYYPGATVSFFAIGTNNGPMTLNYNGIGSRAIVTRDGKPLIAGQVVSGTYLIATYTGSVFQLVTALSDLASDVAGAALRTSGQQRPSGNIFPTITQATSTSINVPAGVAWIVPPNTDLENKSAIRVEWTDQVIALSYLAATASTTIAVNSLGTIVQIPGKASGAMLRDSAILGVVQHLTGVIGAIATRPMIFADENYRSADAAALLTNSLVSGGRVTPNAVNTLQLDISNGTIFSPGYSSDTMSAPNSLNFPAAASIQFRTFAGANVVGGSLILDAPVTQYDPAGSGVVTTIPNAGDAVVHRLYYLYGAYIWLFGQHIYTSVENACSLIDVDRAKFIPPQFLADSTLLAEIVAIKSATDLSNLAQAAILSKGQINFTIGAPGGIADAPSDGFTYGRKDAAWAVTMSGISPQIVTDATVSGGNPKYKTNLTPVGAGVSGLQVKSNNFDWFGLEVTNPDDKAYFRSYNPADGILRNTTTYDLALGTWSFPAGISALGVNSYIGSGGVGATEVHLNLEGQSTGKTSIVYRHNGVSAWGNQSTGELDNEYWRVYDYVNSFDPLQVIRRAGGTYSTWARSNLTVGLGGTGTQSYNITMDCAEDANNQITMRNNYNNSWAIRGSGHLVGDFIGFVDLVSGTTPFFLTRKTGGVFDLSLKSDVYLGLGGVGAETPQLFIEGGSTGGGEIAFRNNALPAWSILSSGRDDLDTFSVFDGALGLTPVNILRTSGAYDITLLGRVTATNGVVAGSTTVGSAKVLLSSFGTIGILSATAADLVTPATLAMQGSTYLVNASSGNGEVSSTLGTMTVRGVDVDIIATPVTGTVDIQAKRVLLSDIPSSNAGLPSGAIYRSGSDLRIVP